MSRTLAVDLYEINMAVSYLRRGMAGPATFSLFARGLPTGRGYLVAAGLEDCLDWLEAFAFVAEDLEWLRQEGFDEADVARLAGLRFTGDVWAVPEGRVVLAGEPLLEVTAPIAEGQLAETYLLNQVTFQTAIASKAARCVVAAGDISLVDFSLRRTHGIEAGDAVARACAMVGFVGTSNVQAARRHGLAASGTMAHSYVEAFPTEVEAFRSFAVDHPNRTTFLVDTYDNRGGIEAAIAVIRELGLRGPLAIRLDSGDLVALARMARRMLDDAGLADVRIFVSGGLDEFSLERFRADGAPIDAAGIGTQMGVSADAPSLDSAYKLVCFGDRSVMKLSEGKSTLPGAKQVWRGASIADDVVGLRDEQAPPGMEPLLVQVMKDGHRVGPRDELSSALARFRADSARIPPTALTISDPVPPRVKVSDLLASETERVRADRLSPRS